MSANSRLAAFLRISVVLLFSFWLTIGWSTGVSISKDTSPYRTDRIIVRYKKGLPEKAVKQRVAARSAQLIHRSKLVPNLCVVQLPKGKSVKQALKEFKKDRDVLYVEPDFRVKALEEPNDERLVEQWAIKNVGQEIPPGSGNYGTFDADIDADLAWDITKGTTAAVIAVLDTGVDYLHADLAPNMWRNTREIPGNGLDDDGNGVPDDVYGINVVGITLEGPGCGARSSVGDPMDDYGHGTHVAGIIGASTNNSRGVAGVNWNTRIMALKFLDAGGSGWTSGAILCLEYLKAMKDRGEPVIAVNASWGGGYSQALYDAIQSLIEYDILFVAAAGNDGIDADISWARSYPAGYDLPNVISVAATDFNDQLAEFSNFGKHTVDVAAPGDNILSLGLQYSRTDPYVYMSGTSMATPFVTGLAGLIKARYPELTWVGIRNLILTGGDAKDSLEAVTVTGRRINANGSLTKTNSLFAVLSPESTEPVFAGTELKVEAISVRGANPSGAVSVTIEETSETYELSDDGTGADIVAGDGIFAATIPVPAEPGQYTLQFASGTNIIEQTLTVRRLYTYEAVEEGYSWIDLDSYESTLISELDDSDEGFALIEAPFGLDFYGETVTTLAVNSNGGIVLDPATDEDAWLPWYAWFPMIQPPRIVAPFWSDLMVDTAGAAASHVYYAVIDPDDDPGTANRQLVIEWRNVIPYEVWLMNEDSEEFGGEEPPPDPSDGFTFQVIFYENEPWKITYQYKDAECALDSFNYGAQAVVGVQNYPLFTVFSQYEVALSNEMAIDFNRLDGAALLDVQPGADEGLIFGTVRQGSSVTKQVSIINRGDRAATVAYLSIVGVDEETPPSADFAITSAPELPFEVGPGEVMTFAVSYAPSDRGVDSAVLQIETSLKTYSMSLLGQGILDPQIQVVPTSLNFGKVPVGRERVQNLIISNAGDADLTIDRVAFHSDQSSTAGPVFYLQSGFERCTLASGESTTIAVVFSPRGDGAETDKLIIYSDDPDESVAYVDVTGIGYVDEEAPAAFIVSDPEEPTSESGWYSVRPDIRLYSNEESATLYYQWDSTAGTWLEYAGAFQADEGIHKLYCYAVDEAGNLGPVRSRVFKVDVTPPSASAAAPLFSSNLSAVLSAPVSWSGTDNMSGIAAYEVQYALGSSPTWYRWLAWTSATRSSKPCLQGQKLRFRVRARDRAGNVGPWSAEVVSHVPVNETAFRYAGTWSIIRSPSLFMGTARYASQRGAYATYRFYGARQILLLVTKGPGSGFADVYVGSVRVRTIDLYSSRIQRRVPVSIKSFSVPTSGTLKVVVRQAKRSASSGYQVQLDGVIVVR